MSILNSVKTCFGLFLPETNPFGTELISKIIDDLKHGKTADRARLTFELLVYSYPVC